MLPNAEGSLVTPSAVAYREGRLIAAGRALHYGELYPECLATGLLSEGRTLQIEGHSFSWVELVAALIQEVKRAAEVYLGERVYRAVIAAGDPGQRLVFGAAVLAASENDAFRSQSGVGLDITVQGRKVAEIAPGTPLPTTVNVMLRAQSELDRLEVEVAVYQKPARFGLAPRCRPALQSRSPSGSHLRESWDQSVCGRWAWSGTLSVRMNH